MKRAVCILAISILAACGGAGTGTGTDDSIDTSASATARSLVAISNAPDRSFASMLNSVRSVNGAAPVTYDSRLGVAAQRHADDMLAENFFSHTGSDGSTVGTRVTAAGYNWQRVGENIGRGQDDEEDILRAWVNSSGHQANNVDPRFEDFALAKAGTGSQQYWVLVLAREF